MKTEILPLESVVKNGVGGEGAGAIGLIYTFLLQEKQLTYYEYIHVNQVGDDLDEFVMKDGEYVYINIRYPAPDDFDEKTEKERALIRLDVTHKALLMLSEKDDRFEKQTLETIRQEILSNDFSFDFVLKEWAMNLTPYEKPPLFEMMRAGQTSEKVYGDWLHSLPPAAAAIIRRADN